MTRGSNRLTGLVGVVCVLLVVVAGRVGANETPNQDYPGRLVTTEWLAAHLKDPNLVLLHLGQPASYATHIPGARLMSLDDYESLSVSDEEHGGLNLEMIDAEPLRKALEALGISEDSHVVIYHSGRMVPMVTRVMLTLDYAGLGGRASMLDGGLAEWTRQGLPTSDSATTGPAGHLNPLKIQPNVVVDRQFVQDHIAKDGFRIVDGRARAFYEGTSTGGGEGASAHKTGHILSAVNVPYNEVTDTSTKFKSLEDLRAMFDAAGVKPGETVVAYCHLGMQATTTIFAARLLGYDAVLYDGSFEDWSRLENAPVATGKGK